MARLFIQSPNQNSMKKKADLATRRSNASKLHKKALGLCKEAFPSMSIKEEMTVDVDGTKLFVDLYIKELGVVIECHGKQHYEYVPHFHGDKSGFEASKTRDNNKKELLIDSGYTYLELNDKTIPDTPKELCKIIIDKIQNG